MTVFPSATSFKLMDGDEYFTIDLTRGELTLTRTIDWSEAPSLVAVIQSENEGLISSCAVLFNIEDVNNHTPRIISSQRVSLPHPAPRPLHYVVAVDEDSGDNAKITYTMVNGDTSNFALDSRSGALTVNRHVDMDQEITVRASDNGNPARFVEQKIQITLHKSANRWSFFSRPVFELDLNKETPIGTQILEFSSPVTNHFYLLPSDLPFKIDKSNGRIIVANTMSADTYSFTVFVENNESQSDHAGIIINTGKNTTSYLKISPASCGSSSLIENLQATNFKRIVSSGATNATYRIEGGNDGNLFEIDAQTGWLSSRALDRELKDEYNLLIAVAEGSDQDNCTVLVTVLDENDNPPTWNRNAEIELKVEDDTKLGTILASLLASDADKGPNGQIDYSIIDDPSSLLDIDPDTGKISYARELPVLAQETKIRVRATDRGMEKRLYTEKLLTLKDYRTHYEDPPDVPEFLHAKYVGSVEEGEPMGREVLRLSTTHSRRDEKIAYSIVDGNHDSAFEIDENGVIRTALELDREIRGYYELKILATSSLPAQSAAKASITVLNVNDNAPSFPITRKRKLSEGATVGSYITTLLANDVDENSLAEYTIESQLNGGEEAKEPNFAIDSRTGAIHLVKALDREEYENVTLKVKVWDGRHPAYTELFIEILDENDNSPTYNQLVYEATVSRSVNAGDIVVVFGATDKDASEASSQINYSLDDPSGYFKVDPLTGTVSLAKPLEEHHKTKYTSFLMTAIATDNGLPAKSAYAAVRIVVKEENTLSQPAFDLDLYEFTVSEHFSVNMPVGDFTLSGTDSNENHLNFRILDPVAAVHFAIDRFGVLWLRKSLTYARKQLFEFTVDVGTGRGSVKNATVPVTIRIIDENDHSPIFQSVAEMKIPVQEGAQNGQSLARFSAVDEDFGENGRVEIRVVAGEDSNRVRIDDSGILTWNGGDSQDAPNGSIVLLAHDFGIPSRAALIEIPFAVETSKWGQSAPFFVMSEYRKHIREGLSSIRSHDPIEVTRVRAVNRLGARINNLRYSFKDRDSIFSIDPSSGVISSLENLDYEKQKNHALTVLATDGAGRSAVTTVEIEVLPVDEYPPLFSKLSYTFSIPLDADIGQDAGQISAVDGDTGPDGMAEGAVNKYFAIDPTSGVLRLANPIEPSKNGTIETLVIVAESGPLQQSRATVFVEIGGVAATLASGRIGSPLVWSVIAGILVLLLLLTCVLALCIYRHKTRIKTVDSPRKQVYAISKGQISSMADIGRTSPIKPRLPPRFPAIKQSSSRSSSASEHPNLRHSGLSSREFLSNRSQPDSGIDQDTVSLTSSVNEYLHSLGVSLPAKKNQRNAREMDALIYARLEDVVRHDPDTSYEYQHVPSHLTPSPQQTTSDALSNLQRRAENYYEERVRPAAATARFVDI
ncbi:unnamed protein product, partial [Mesorhabditis spiculigera]